MGKEGDIKVEWNPDNKKEVGAARKAFEENIKKYFKAFRMYDDDKKGEPLEKFDMYAERILFVPLLVGG
jgi:hypothetical protein